tara:strand:- start:390 stop:1562 length:1173 start_codon:yes stop_codon:yes gene_type:complete
MSIFKEHKTSADRSATDRRRHKQKIEKAIREGVHNIVAEESIIGQDGKKKIRIPVRGIKEYRFIYGDNNQNQRVGSAPGKNIKRGQQVGDKEKPNSPTGGKPGNEAGVEYYDVEITLEELADYLFNDLELPDLEKKAMKKIMSEKMKRSGYRSKGIRPRLDKKNSLKRKLKRKAHAKRMGTSDEEERFPFHDDDLRYKHIKNKVTETSNAVIFFLMDISGSMTKEKKYLARSFFFLLYHFINHKYENVELVFVAHDTNAYEVNEDQFFKRGAGGGTMVSSAIEMTLDIISQRYFPDSWNIYSFHCSDGDNWPQDTDKCLTLTNKLRDVCQLYGYCEIEPNDERARWTDPDSVLSNTYTTLVGKNFKIVKIEKSEDIWPAFKRLFGGKLGV